MFRKGREGLIYFIPRSKKTPHMEKKMRVNVESNYEA